MTRRIAAVAITACFAVVVTPALARHQKKNTAEPFFDRHAIDGAAHAAIHHHHGPASARRARSTPAPRHAAHTGRDCLHHSARAVLDKLEARFGKVTLVKTCVPGARMPSGHVSWHALNQAFDFNVPSGIDKRDVMVWLSKNSPGVTISYVSMPRTIHTDTGSFHKVIYNAANHEAGHRAVAIWQDRERRGVQVAALPPHRERKSQSRVLQNPAPWTVTAAFVDPDFEAAPLAPLKPEPIGSNDRSGIFRRYAEGRIIVVLAALDSARNYLVRTATIGGTMARQGPDVAIGRLHPVFAVRLAAAIKQARIEGLPNVGCYSAYREPAFGVGGYRNKFDSNHAYGLYCDMAGIGRPGSKEAKRWHRIAGENGIYNPYYGTRMTWEWNHYGVTPTVKAVAAIPALRKTITANGPIDNERMWQMSASLIDKQIGGGVRVAKRYVKKTRYAKHRKPSRYASAG